PTSLSINRLFPGSRWIFFEKRTTASPNRAVRSSRSNGCRPAVAPSLSTQTSPNESGQILWQTPAASFDSGDRAFGVALGFGLWNLRFLFFLSYSCCLL